MILSLTDNEGRPLETWYLSDEEYDANGVDLILNKYLEMYEDRAAYEEEAEARKDDDE